jgi:hypothetical protein
MFWNLHKRIGAVHEHSLLQCETHTWHFDTGNNTSEVWLFITLPNIVAIVTWDLEFKSGLAHDASAYFMLAIQWFVWVILMRNCNVYRQLPECVRTTLLFPTQFICVFCIIHVCYISCSWKSSWFYPIHSQHCLVYITLDYENYFGN